MADIETANTIGEQYAAPTVYLKDDLAVATAWALSPFLFCSSLELKCNTWDECRLSYDFGYFVRQPGYERDPDWEDSGSHLVKTYLPLDLTGKFVRVLLNPADITPSYWYGYIIGEDKQRTNDESGSLTGQRQFFRAVGLAYFLARKQIRTAFIHDGVEIGRGLVFNGGDNARLLGADRKGRANMHPADDSNSERCFYDHQDTSSPPELWPATKILDHVLQYHGTQDFAGNLKPAQFFRGTGAAQFLDDWYPTIRTDNRTPLDVLNALANPKRGLCWWAEYNDVAGPATGSIYIYVNSLTPTTINLNQGSSGTLPANSDKESLSYDTDRHVASSRIGVPDSRAYKQVICRGARQTGTGTFVFDYDVEANWTSAERQQYLDAAKDSDGYDGLSEDAKKRRNDAWRRSPNLSAVFSSFRVANDWDGKVFYLPPGELFLLYSPLFPDVSAAGVVSGQRTHYWSGLRVLNTLACSPGGAAPDVDNPEFERLLAFVEVETSPSGSQLVDKLSTARFEVGTPLYAEKPASYHLRPEPDILGIRLQSSKLPHTLAKGSFNGAAISAVEEEYDFRDLRFTVTIEGDHHAEGIYPATGASTDIVEQLTIDMGDAYRLDYMAPGAVLSIGEGQDVYADAYRTGTVEVASGVVTLTGGTFPDWAADGVIRIEATNYTIDTRDSDTQVTLDDTGVTVSSGASFEISNPSEKLIRNDQEVLADFARFAFEWYSADRRELEVAWRRVDVDNFTLGKMITTVGEGSGQETVNTVIGAIAYDFGAGTTSIRTLPDQLDLPGLLS